MQLPPFDDHGNLPPGQYLATWKEVEEGFGWNFRRRYLLGQLRFVIESLIGFGVSNIFLDGSFVTAKERPGDIEVVYVPPPNVNYDEWGIFAPTRVQHTLLKQKHDIDLWPYPSPQPSADGWISILDFFSSDRDGNEKGIVHLDLDGFE